MEYLWNVFELPCNGGFHYNVISPALSFKALVADTWTEKLGFASLSKLRTEAQCVVGIWQWWQKEFVEEQGVGLEF